ncbi:hypothetical protein AL047_15180 [Pseudomonas syringae pv. broussonetiae]|nr:hypothetical protein AL047_15180 [Pseudomonas syringae pv. broussonetiae]
MLKPSCCPLINQGLQSVAGTKNRINQRLLKHFVKVTEHPAQTDVIFYPEEGQEDTPEGILKTIKEWRAKNGKPGFKT